MNAPSDERVVKRGKVRKGTHSCWECRRRKVKCTFASPKDTVCITCHRRGTKCASQTDICMSEITTKHADSLDEQPGSDGVDAGPPWRDAGVLCESSAGSSECQPPGPSPNLLIHDVSPTAPLSSHVSLSERSTHSAITQALLQSLPSRKDIKILLGKITEVPLLFYQSRYMSRDNKQMPKERTSMANLLHPEAHPVLLAGQMLRFAVALQFLSPNERIPGLTAHHHVIMERLAESASRLVNANDVLLGTLEGLDNLMWECMYHIDGGNIRRGWITTRRAVMAAHLLGLHRPCHYRFKVIKHQAELNPEDMWSCIVSREGVLSLLLGLPSNTVATGFATQDVSGVSEQGFSLSVMVMGVTAKILERNQVHNSQQALEMTQEIDREFARLAEQVPSAFWRQSSFAGLHADSMDALFEIRRTWDNMLYHTLINQLHLPYMLRPGRSPQNIYSRIACVNASREVLFREIALRTFNPITTCSRMGDFMALIAGMTLMLAHIVSHCQKGLDNLLVHQRLSDRATVEQALQFMQSMSELRDDVLSAKCSVLLKDLLAVEADAAQGNKSLAHMPLATNGGHGDDQDVLQISVPYVGTIKITRKGIISMAPSKPVEERSLQDGVTIGGIGSLHVNSAGLPDENSVDGTPDVAVPQVAAIERVVNAPLSSQVTSGDADAQQDDMFPDAAASMDNWVFQGFDTAFFDLLMRDAGDQQLNNTTAEGWDF